MRPARAHLSVWKRHRAAITEAVSDVLMILGLGALVVAFWGLDPRAGLAVAGLGLGALGYVVAPRGG